MRLGHRVMVAGMPETDRRWNTLRAWRAEIEVVVVNGVTNARTAATKTLIKNIKRTERGFRNPDDCRAHILLRSAINKGGVNTHRAGPFTTNRKEPRKLNREEPVYL